MPEIESGSIQFVVTSPPYWNLKKYGSDSSNSRQLNSKQAYLQYLHEIQNVLREVKRVMEPGRFVSINIGTAISNDRMRAINADVQKIMEDLNFTFKKEIIWVKPKGTQGLWQRGVTKFLKTEPYPCFFNLNIMHEYILIFQNDGSLQVNLTDKSKLSEEFVKQVAWSVWDMPISLTKGHPAPFPYAIPERLIKLYTFENDTVLDPFGGSGTTMKAARDQKRNSILYEINPEYIELIKNKVNWNKRSLYSDAKYEIKVRNKQQPITN
jgi:site-specific DNA-methyltransferase (adenine-specific)